MSLWNEDFTSELQIISSKTRLNCETVRRHLLPQSEPDEFVPAGLQEVLDVFLPGSYTRSLQSVSASSFHFFFFMHKKTPASAMPLMSRVPSRHSTPTLAFSNHISHAEGRAASRLIGT